MARDRAETGADGPQWVPCCPQGVPPTSAAVAVAVAVAGGAGEAASRPLTTARTFGRVQNLSGRQALETGLGPDSAVAVVVVRFDLGLLNRDNEQNCVGPHTNVDITWMHSLHCKFLANNTLKAVSNSMRRDDKYFSVQ